MLVPRQPTFALSRCCHTCYLGPRCMRRVAEPKGRSFACPHCGLVGHRDIVGAVNIASPMCESGELVSMPDTTMHRRAGRHLPGAGCSRRDPRRTRWEISRELRESWPGVGRPEETASLGSSSSPEVGVRGSTDVGEHCKRWLIRD
jgi:hypothetical protein